jgi:hypothetical protein
MGWLPITTAGSNRYFMLAFEENHRPWCIARLILARNRASATADAVADAAYCFIAT